MLNIEKPLTILVRRRAALGDTIMSTGIVRELKKKYNCEIDVATEFLEVYNNNPHIKNLYHASAMPDPSAYDLYINLDDAYEYNPINNYLDSYFYRAFGTPDVDNKSVELFPNKFDMDIVNSFCQDNELDKYIVIHIRQWYWELKNMSWDTWYSVFSGLFEERVDFKIVCVGSITDGTVDHPLFVDAREKLNVQQQKLLMDNASCFVGIDSGPYHIAAASTTPIVSLHTHLLPERIVPTWKKVTPILSNVDCTGCNDKQQRPVREVICKYGDFRCSNNFDANEIVNAILENL
ncbi:RfaF ADP-heptose,LPS heptosyltransferase [uncultured Caudovirales phage]|uniref:RfaF ADP-heptose,LPS heptosyltransferase n=1 Tax=uncultured Caudovirales phage TaxID=2100421 RepID=A0A6J5LIU7_9CAUD|nr:RfaF ADP-heptose,LPS heptosyltransferase [uncultured Caudovirales phage]